MVVGDLERRKGDVDYHGLEKETICFSSKNMILEVRFTVKTLHHICSRLLTDGVLTNCIIQNVLSIFSYCVETEYTANRVPPIQLLNCSFCHWFVLKLVQYKDFVLTNSDIFQEYANAIIMKLSCLEINWNICILK
jgi:hypothetical protein